MRILLRSTLLTASVLAACWGFTGCSNEPENNAGKPAGGMDKMDTGKMGGGMDKMDTGKMDKMDTGKMDKMDTGKMDGGAWPMDKMK